MSGTRGGGLSLADWSNVINKKATAATPFGQVRAITVAEIWKHYKPTDCWISIKGKVYDVTTYMQYHPGGMEELMRGVGDEDATVLYNEIHSWVNAEAMLKNFCIGTIVPNPGNPWFKMDVVQSTALSHEFYKVDLRLHDSAPAEVRKIFEHVSALPLNRQSACYGIHHWKLRLTLPGKSKQVERTYTPFMDTFLNVTKTPTTGDELVLVGGEKKPTDAEEHGKDGLTIRLIVKAYSKMYQTSWFLTHPQEFDNNECIIQLKPASEKTFWRADDRKKIGFLIGGSAIAVVLQLLAYELMDWSDDKEVWLVWLNHSQESLVLLDHLQASAKRMNGKLRVTCINRIQIGNGPKQRSEGAITFYDGETFNGEFLKSHADILPGREENAKVFYCASVKVERALRMSLLQAGYEPSDIGKVY